MKNYSTLKDQVYDYITSHIVKGDLLPNKKINELQVCKDLGISRTPVREALIQLASEGILVNEPHKGFLIKSLSDSHAAELYTLIGTIDGLSAALSCDHLTEETLKEMEFYTLSMDLAINTDNFSMYYKQQEIFHQLYMNECRNQTLIEELLSLKRKLLKKNYYIEDEEQKKQTLLTTNSEHKYMLELFKKNKKQELRDFLENVHWIPDKATFESFEK